MIGSNVFGQAQQYQTQAGNTYNQLANFSPTAMNAAQLGSAQTMQGVGAVQSAQAPGQIGVNQLATTNLNPYMSPYTQNVIETGQADIERQRQMASNQLGAQAQAAGAFGGSRQGVQEGVLAGEALRQAGALSAQQRQQAFNTALQSGQFDIGNVQQARTLASGQDFQANQFSQQAQEAAAAREQATRAGNMQAANQFAIQQAQYEQAASQANYQGQFQAANVQSGAAGGLRGLGSTMFGQGMRGLEMQQAAAARAQQQQQAMLNAGRQQTLANLGYPGQALQTGTGVLGALPSATMTESGTPGLLGILSGLSGLPTG
tara:strand:- start:1339 stop:2292 length:954 start_codon:yes stop_codon:yes gene_type:complete